MEKMVPSDKWNNGDSIRERVRERERGKQEGDGIVDRKYSVER